MISLYLHLIAGHKIGLLIHSTMSKKEFGILLKAANLLINQLPFNCSSHWATVGNKLMSDYKLGTHYFNY